MGWARHVARIGEVRITFKILVGKPEGERPLGRPKRRREDDVKRGRVPVNTVISRRFLHQQCDYKLYQVGSFTKVLFIGKFVVAYINYVVSVQKLSKAR
jgi:hypothetical protein